MTRAAEIWFIRHAESTANVEGRWQGQGDAPLSPRGRRQAAALARRLAGERLDLVIASDLARATDTALALGRPVERRREWRELDVGAWEGLTRAEVAERFADQVAALRRGEPVKVGGGESWDDLRVRVLDALTRLRARLDDGARVAVVAHGGVILTLVSALLGIAERRPRPIGRLDNTGMTRIRFGPDGVEIAVYNDATHLAPVGDWCAARVAAGDAAVSLVCGAGAPPGRAFDALYAPGEDAPGPDLDAALRAIAARHPGAHVGLVAAADRIAAATPGLLGLAPPALDAARFAVPDEGRAAPLVVSPGHATLAAWNLP